MVEAGVVASREKLDEFVTAQLRCIVRQIHFSTKIFEVLAGIVKANFVLLLGDVVALIRVDAEYKSGVCNFFATFLEQT